MMVIVVFFLLDFDVLNSFYLMDAVNGVYTSDNGDNEIFFRKTTDDIVTSHAILHEFTSTLKQHESFIVSFKMQPEPFHKGSVIWLEHKATGKVFFSWTLVEIT